MQKVIKIINKVTECILITLVVVMVLACLWQIFARYVLGQASARTDELMRYSLIWVTILGGAYVYGERGHLAITFIFNKFSAAVKAVLELVIELMVALFAIVLFIGYGSRLVSQTLSQTSPGLGIPIGYVYCVLPIAGVLFTLYAAYQSSQFINILRKGGRKE
jgi:TRAP-type C4-dicarboxylate transport system permease small subunit